MKTSGYEEIINNLIKDNYKHLKQVATNVAKSKGKNNNVNEVISDLILHLHDNQHKLESYIERETLLGYAVTYISTQLRYDNSQLNKRDLNKDYELIDNITEDISLTYDDDFDMLNIDEFELDMIENGYTKEQIDKIRFAVNIYWSLDPIEQNIYKLYFIQGLSIRDIVKITNVKISVSTVHLFIKQMREKIKSQYEQKGS